MTSLADADVVVVGGGLAGSTATAMLARKGYSVVLVDPHAAYPPDFRCEKLDGPQMRILERTGLAEAVKRIATPDTDAWVAQLGRLVERRPGDQHGIRYDAMVNAIRHEIPSSARFVRATVADIECSDELQCVRLLNGDRLTARLVVLANGLNAGLRRSLNMERQMLSSCHSVTIGFDMAPGEGRRFPFSSLSYYGERPRDRVAYLTLFPIGAEMRANFMVYRDMRDPWLDRLREAPQMAVSSVLRGLENLTGPYEVQGHIKIRPADLYITRDAVRGGMVVVGDAFSTSCPAAGTGTGKVFTDVERLCNRYVPEWLATTGMGLDKVRAFYSDPDKVAYDGAAIQKAHRLKALCTGTSLRWRSERAARFAYRLGAGAIRDTRRPHDPGEAIAAALRQVG